MFPNYDTTYGIDPNTNQSVQQYSPNNVAAGLLELSNLHQSLLAVGGLIATGNQDEPNVIIRKPWLDAPDGAYPFDEGNSVVLPAVGVSAVLVSHTVPLGYDGVINAYSWNFLGASFVDGSGDIVVQILRNGTPIRNYDHVTVQKGSIEIPRPIAPMRIYSGQVISIVVAHAGNVALNGNIVGTLVGYDYPSRG